MTATAPPQPTTTRAPRTGGHRSGNGRNQADWSGSFVAPAAAGLATICASTALTGVIQGWSWLSHIIVAVVLVGCTGLALRSMRTPAPMVALAQVAVLLMLVTGMFTGSGILAVIPGPAAFNDLAAVLAAAGEDIRTSLPPVEPSAPIMCLATIGIGLIAVLVDTLAVAMAAPAAAGLVLLCLYAVPASLADEMLPWWTFGLGAAAFAILIAVDGNHRHRQWRGKPGPAERTPAAASTPAAVVGVAVALGLVAGASFTAIGTVGKLPFVEGGKASDFNGGLGLQPFTELRGLLNDQGSSEVFRVQGLASEKRLMRAFTLDTYEPNQGWRLHEGPMPAGVEANTSPLPRAPGDTADRSQTLRVDPIRWRDVWLPIYGSPREIRGIDNSWYYDQTSGSVYSERPQRPPAYNLQASLRQPEREELRNAVVDNSEVPEIYTEVADIDPEVRALTENIVAGRTNSFDKANALWEFFTAEGRFTYDTKTASASGSDALADFLLKGRRGFCAQFASSMAVMLRMENIPARVAIGFTAGTEYDNYRSISTRDAHAWVEAYFGKKHGWVPFDPTPLDGGRGFVPPYLESDGADSRNNSNEDDGSSEPSATPTEPEPPEGVEPGSPGANQAAKGTSLAQAPGWARWPTLFIVFMAIALTAGAVLVVRRSSEVRGQLGAEVLELTRERLSAARIWLPIATAAGWLLSVGLLGWMVSWLLALALLVAAGVLVAPAMLREFSRGRRLRDITMSRPGAAEAAWRELLDECADRGTPVNSAETIRQTARQLATEHNLDEEGRRHLHTVVGILERSWYSPDDDVDAEFAAAFEGLRQALNRGAPLSWRGRMLPTSVLKR